MAKGQPLTRHQQGIVRRHYQHRDTVVTTRLAELVSDLYLCTDAGKAQRLWKSALEWLEKAGANAARTAKIAADRDVKALAQLVNELANPR